MFNYPNNKMDADANRVVTKSFAFGRVCGTTVNTRAAVLTYPYLVKTVSVMGGRCNNNRISPATRCRSGTTSAPRPPSRLRASSTQGQRMGRHCGSTASSKGSLCHMGGRNVAWDFARAPTGATAGPVLPEIYCRNSFLPGRSTARSASAINADATGFAVAWGHSPG